MRKLVFRKITIEELYRAISCLNKDEQELIAALFFDGETERSYAEKTGVYRNAVHMRKVRILAKLKKFLK